MTTPDVVDSGARGSILVGTTVIAIFFAGFGGWAATAPLSSAVIAPAVVQVEGNRKSVQHLEGGIVREIRVKDGDRVEAGQVLLVLDDTQRRGAVDLLVKQLAELGAREARLLAERDAAASVRFPDTLLFESAPMDLSAIFDEEEILFEKRQAELGGRIEIMRKKISQSRELIAGLQGELDEQKFQLESIRAELADLEELFEKGFVQRQPILGLEREAAALKGQIARTAATIEQRREEVQELELQIEQLHVDRIAEVAEKLREARIDLADVRVRLHVAREALERTAVRAPTAGVIVGLAVFTVGGVIAAGERIMEIVPDHGEVSIEAMIDVDDQKDVFAGMTAEVHLTAYKRRSSPIVEGSVLHVSPDRLTDQRTGAAFYVATIKIARQEALSGDVRLIPGMSALVVIPTGDRTALDYLLRPLTDSFVRGFREQ